MKQIIANSTTGSRRGSKLFDGVRFEIRCEKRAIGALPPFHSDTEGQIHGVRSEHSALVAFRIVTIA